MSSLSEFHKFSADYRVQGAVNESINQRIPHFQRKILVAAEVSFSKTLSSSGVAVLCVTLTILDLDSWILKTILE